MLFLSLMCPWHDVLEGGAGVILRVSHFSVNFVKAPLNEKLKIKVELRDTCSDTKLCEPPISAYVQPHSPDEATPAWIVQFLASCKNGGLFGRD